MELLPLPPKPNVLGPVDTAFFYAETPTNPMNLGALTIFEGRIDFDKLVQLIESRIAQAPPYQRRLVQAPFRLGPPTWVLDAHFHIGNHVFYHNLPKPGSDEQLSELTGHIVSRVLNKDKPLWEIHVVGGLHDSRTAVLFKVHHCMVDGLSAIDLFTMLMDFSPNPNVPTDKPSFTPSHMPSAAELLRDAFIFDIPTKIDVARKVSEEVGILADVVKDPEKRRKALVGLAYLASDSTKMIRKLAINGQNSGRQMLVMAEFPLDEVKMIRRVKGASVNDVMVSILAGAVRAYVGPRGDRIDTDYVRLLVPVNMRAPGEQHTYGNRISLLPIDVPLHIEDPLDRLASVTDFSHRMKESSLSNTLDLVLTLPSLLPSVLQPMVWKIAPQIFSLLAHTWCTNVAGPPVPVYMLGHELKQVFGFFPLNPNMGMACVIASYNGKITMTAVIDKAIIPDFAFFQQAIEDSYKMLRTAARKASGIVVEVETALGVTVEVVAPRLEQPPTQRPINDPYPAEIETGKIIEADEPISPEERPVEVEHPPRVEDADAPAEPHNALETVSEGVLRMPSAGETPSDSAGQPTFSPNGTNLSARQASQKPVKHKPFTESWAAAYHDALNANKAYYAASTRWDAGAVALVTLPEIHQNIPHITAVLLDLDRGKCRSAGLVTLSEAMQKAAFVIEGDYATWMEVLAGHLSPLGAITRGKLRLKKGALTRLLPFTKSAAELVKTAQLI